MIVFLSLVSFSMMSSLAQADSAKHDKAKTASKDVNKQLQDQKKKGQMSQNDFKKLQDQIKDDVKSHPTRNDADLGF